MHSLRPRLGENAALTLKFLTEVTFAGLLAALRWDLVGDLAELACDVYLERGILVQPVPISLRHWLNPERFPRLFLRLYAARPFALS